MHQNSPFSDKKNSAEGELDLGLQERPCFSFGPLLALDAAACSPYPQGGPYIVSALPPQIFAFVTVLFIQYECNLTWKNRLASEMTSYSVYRVAHSLARI